MKIGNQQLWKFVAGKHTSRPLAILFLLVLLALFVLPAIAQTGGGYDLTWNTVDGGGGMGSTGSGYNLGGTFGQPDAGLSNGGTYALDSGFWGTVAGPVQPVLVGHVRWQGPLAQPNNAQQLPITITLKIGATEVSYLAQNTDPNGFFTVTIGGLITGTYNWRVKGPNGAVQTSLSAPAGFLANNGTLILTGAATTQVEMGLMRAGDCNNDNVVNAGDFTILKNTFGKALGHPGYDSRADFNNDYHIDANDFNLLRGNFGIGGSPPIGPGTGGPAKDHK